MPDSGLISNDLENVKKNNPLVVNVTNNVVTNYTANALLALGASPAMSHDAEDLKELAALAGALVVNIGTPGDEFVRGMTAAGDAAHGKGVPIVIDPVATGVTKRRTRMAVDFIDAFPPAVIRGNASEIMSLAGGGNSAKGVDSRLESNVAKDAAIALAKDRDCVVCVSGIVDIVTDGSQLVYLKNGKPMMSRVTGMGCTATALCAAFAAVSETFFDATVGAMAVMGVAGDLAAERALGPGTFQLHFLDALYRLDDSDIAGRLKMSA